MDAVIAKVVGDVSLVLAVSAIFGVIACRCGQPSVVGQIVAGVLFGPTLLGRMPGHLTAYLFPQDVLGYLNILSQIAVVIFMFGVGYEISWPKRGRLGGAAPLVAVSALLVPMALSVGAVLAFRSTFAVGGPPISGASSILFMAVALSITALPVLAAIVRERGLAHTTAGATAITAAGIMDVCAWLALAYALTERRSALSRPFPETLGLLASFILVMVFAVRPSLRWWLSRRRNAARPEQLSVALVLALGAAFVSTELGVHPMFGGFIAGLIMPRVAGKPDPEVLRRTEETSSLLLPLFFVITGLSTNIGALHGGALVALVLVCAVAGIGKIGSAYAASRGAGLTSQDSATIAVLVNTRGLTELIALNAGLQAGIIGYQLFSILVVMALLMTVATAPLLRLLVRFGVQSEG